MADNNESKTKEQLIEEINALREQLAAHDADTGKDASGDSHEPTFAKPMTRREALTTWIAPVVLSVPVVAAMSSETARAAPQEPQLPTQYPAPTLPEAESVPGLGAAGAVVLGGALAAAGAKMLKDKKDASGDDGSEDTGGNA